MSNPFFERPIVNSPYEYPHQHWELDPSGQPTGKLIKLRRREFITPIPKPKKRKGKDKQEELVLDEGLGLTTKQQAYDLTSIINEVRSQVDAWRALAPSQWQVTPETARLLQHWRHHEFGGARPFFCQVEAVETAIWFTEVAPHTVSGKKLLENLKAVNSEANPSLERLALKLATGGDLDPLKLPNKLQTALEALYGHYEKTFCLWQKRGISVPPCFIVVCQNTAILKLIYDFISAFHRKHEDGTETLEHGRLALFRNFDETTGNDTPLKGFWTPWCGLARPHRATQGREP